MIVFFVVVTEKPMLPLGLKSPVVLSLEPVVPGMLHRDAIITSTQSIIQNQLQRKHEELQQLIMKQQGELQLVSEQLHVAQRGILPVVSSTQMESQYVNRHQIDNIGNHRTMLRLMDNSMIINNNEQQTYMEHAVNQSVCHMNENPSNASITLNLKSNTMDQMPLVHSSQEFHNSKSMNNFDDTSTTAMSPAPSTSISRTIGSDKFTSASE